MLVAEAKLRIGHCVRVLRDIFDASVGQEAPIGGRAECRRGRMWRWLRCFVRRRQTQIATVDFEKALMEGVPDESVAETEDGEPPQDVVSLGMPARADAVEWSPRTSAQARSKWTRAIVASRHRGVIPAYTRLTSTGLSTLLGRLASPARAMESRPGVRIV